MLISGSGKPPSPVPALLQRVQAAAPHIGVRVLNPFDSDAVVSLPVQEALATMMAPCSHGTGSRAQESQDIERECTC